MRKNKIRFYHDATREKTDWFWIIRVPLNDGHGSVKLDLDEPVFMRIRAANLQNYNLFISPGDRLDIAPPETKNGPVMVTGNQTCSLATF
ncbi:hypothetical protein [Parapedobacter sp. 10938]|uniref:hypothetical protein n=1 Tax=Parapedobacter flavus TaxID=3110225 RepID=UPI002DB826EB|nr:hypothetical protein [Parapedobacter sp. 10938]MEC3880828.1 hypothetical protein [Parapedobacter sp. 10938]